MIFLELVRRHLSISMTTPVRLHNAQHKGRQNGLKHRDAHRIACKRMRSRFLVWIRVVNLQQLKKPVEFGVLVVETYSEIFNSEIFNSGTQLSHIAACSTLQLKLDRTLKYSTLKYSTLKYSTLKYSTLKVNSDISLCVQLCMQLKLDLTLKYSTLKYSTLKYSTLKYSTLKYSTLKYSTQKYSTLKYSTLKYSTLKYSTLKYSTLKVSADISLFVQLCNSTHI